MSTLTTVTVTVTSIPGACPAPARSWRRSATSAWAASATIASGQARGRNDMVIRDRNPADDDAIRRLNDEAFAGSSESKLVEDLRAASLAAIELVAAEGTAIVGHILFGKLDVTLGAKPVRALSLAPMSVRPDRQRTGIGSALVRSGLELARRRGWQAVIVLGHPGYYPRFGFSADVARPLEAPFAGDAFMALELVAGALRGNDGLVVYPPAFGLDQM